MGKLQPTFEISDESILMNLHIAAVEAAIKVCKVNNPDYDIVNSLVTDENDNASNIKTKFKLVNKHADGEIAIIKKFEDFSNIESVKDSQALEQNQHWKKIRAEAFKGLCAYLKTFAGEKSVSGLSEDDITSFIPYQNENTVRVKDGEFVSMSSAEFEKFTSSRKNQQLSFGFKISFSLV